MINENGTSLLLAQWTRLIARGISTLATAFWLLILLDIIACDVFVGFICLDWETILLFGLVVASALSVFIAWKKERIGGLVMILWGLAFSAIGIATSYGSYLAVSILASGVPFLIAGILFLASGWLSAFKASNDAKDLPE